MKRNWKNPSKDRTSITLNGVTYSVPKNRAKQFRQAMGIPKPERKSLTRNQWANKAYRYE